MAAIVQVYHDSSMNPQPFVPRKPFIIDEHTMRFPRILCSGVPEMNCFPEAPFLHWPVSFACDFECRLLNKLREP